MCYACSNRVNICQKLDFSIMLQYLFNNFFSIIFSVKQHFILNMLTRLYSIIYEKFFLCIIVTEFK